MKRLVLIVTAVLVLVLGVIGCAQKTPAPPPDIPRYTADQVIAVAQAQYKSYRITKQPPYADARVSVVYQGKGVWEVTVSALAGYVLMGPGGLIMGATKPHFYESTGSLVAPAPTYKPPATPSLSPTEVLSSQQTAAQVISLVVAQAVRKLSSYKGHQLFSSNWTAVNEVGEWVAAYQGGGEWTVVGTVAFGDGQNIYRYRTGWIYDYKTARLGSLVKE